MSNILFIIKPIGHDGDDDEYYDKDWGCYHLHVY